MFVLLYMRIEFLIGVDGHFFTTIQYLYQYLYVSFTKIIFRGFYYY